MKSFLTLSTLLFLITTSAAIAQETPSRKYLLQGVLKQNVSAFQVQEITMPAGVSARKHMHPSPVVGYVVKGRVWFQIEGEDEKILKDGDAFYEPRNKPILHFDNLSLKEPLTFVAIYLKEGTEENTRFIKDE
ncbi:MAG TPA: cupin domain-containing protein, partial [Sphingobacteriaceae bacterium]